MIKTSTLPILDRSNYRKDNIKLAHYVSVLCKKYTMNNRVLLIQPPQFILDTFNLKVAKAKGCYAYPPTGLQCIAKALAKRNLDIDILDLNYLLLKRVISDSSFNYLHWLDILDEYLDKNQPSIIGITCISIYTDVFKATHPLTCLLRHLHKKDKSIIIAGGPIASNEYENYLKYDLCHFVIEGEGENKINFLFDSLFQGQSNHTSVANIYFKFENIIEETGGKKDTVILKGNLIDTYKSLPIEDYHNVGSLNPFSRMAGQNKKFSVIQLNRGCRANCKFCGVVEFMGKGLRQYPISDLIQEIYYQVEKKDIRHFEILDDDFLGFQGDRGGVTTLLEEMAKLNKKYKISWAAGNGLIAASLNEELLTLMRDSGCVGFRIGIESGNEQMLRRMRKPTSLPLLKKVGRMLNEFPEIFTCGNYIIGLFAEETFSEMLDTFRFANELDLDWAAFSAFQFTSRARVITENLISMAKPATDFIPAKDTSNKEIEIMETKEIISGYEIFNIAKDTVPSPEQIKQIWFAFNFVTNYINNKNLKPNGNPRKFIFWLRAVQVAYPENAYMPLFMGIGHMLLNEPKLAYKYLKKTKENLKISKYWIDRFKQFDLINLVTDFPKNRIEAQEALDYLRKKYHRWTNEEVRISKEN